MSENTSYSAFRDFFDQKLTAIGLELRVCPDHIRELEIAYCIADQYGQIAQCHSLSHQRQAAVRKQQRLIRAYYAHRLAQVILSAIYVDFAHMNDVLGQASQYLKRPTVFDMEFIHSLRMEITSENVMPKKAPPKREMIDDARDIFAKLSQSLGATTPNQIS